MAPDVDIPTDAQRAVAAHAEGPLLVVGEAGSGRTEALARRLEAGLLLDPQLGGEDLLAAMRGTPASEYVTQDPVTGEVRVLAAADVARVLSA